MIFQPPSDPYNSFAEPTIDCVYRLYKMRAPTPAQMQEVQHDEMRNAEMLDNWERLQGMQGTPTLRQQRAQALRAQLAGQPYHPNVLERWLATRPGAAARIGRGV